MEPTIYSASLLLWGCRTASDRVGEYWSNASVGVQNITPSTPISPIVCCSPWLGADLSEPSRGVETKIWEEFSGEKALAHVQRLVDLGPHPVGSKAIEKARDYIEEQLRHSGWQVRRQAFTDDTPRGKTHFVNLIARFSGDAKAASPSFLLGSHYDTKLFDTIQFVGANDGGSSTGLLLELARVLGNHPNLPEKLSWCFSMAKRHTKIFLTRTVCMEAVISPNNSKPGAQNNFVEEFYSTWLVTVLSALRFPQIRPRNGARCLCRV